MDWLRLSLVVAVTFFSSLTALHALLTKRDSRAALGWIAVCLTFPFVGPVLYFLFGINRVRTRAREMHARSLLALRDLYDPVAEPAGDPWPDDALLPEDLAGVARLSRAVSHRPLVAGNTVEMLEGGEEAFPAMLAAIAEARETAYLSTYIFETNASGAAMISALAAAAARGVDVRVILDGIGELYSRPRAGRLLADSRVRLARFLPPKLYPPTVNINLRNHRKILVADARVAFTGGMNIGDRHLARDTTNPDRVVDAHFRLRGPIAAQVQSVFLEDWRFATGEKPAPVAPAPAVGPALCRTIVEGPNEDLDELLILLIGIVSLARKRVWFMTPYFLPPAGLISAMQAAALRGVEVCVVLPERNNLPYVAWATSHMLWELLQRGVRVYAQPGPFVHTKLLLMDDGYVQIGSANVDPRSLRLNFELVVEVFDAAFAECIRTHFESARARAREITLADLMRRSLGARVRDATAWLFSPYL